MHSFSHLFDDPLIGVALLFVLVIFLIAIGFAIYSSYAKQPVTYRNKDGFMYVSTAIVGLVLSVASGVLGAPAKVEGVSVQPNTSVSQPVQSEQDKAKIASAQIDQFRNLYAWTYVVAGIICLVVFMCPTPRTDDLVKGVGLTMLGFLITIVGTHIANNGEQMQAIRLTH